MRLEGLGQLKNPVISLGIEPATFRLVAYCLNQLRYRVPPAYSVENEISAYSYLVANLLAHILTVSEVL
jgi:hypothetical protein